MIKFYRPSIHNWSLAVGEIFGYPILFHITVLIWFLLPPLYWGWGIFLISVSLHAFAHVLVGRKVGYDIDVISIWCFGNFFAPKNQTRTLFEQNQRERYTYALAVAAGPMSNLALAISSWYIGQQLDLLIFTIIGLVNFTLVCFNLIPSPRLYGGQLILALTLSKFRRQQIYFGMTLALIVVAIICILSVIPFIIVPIAIASAIDTFKIARTPDKEFNIQIATIQALMEKDRPDSIDLGQYAWVEPATTSIEEMLSQDAVDLWLIKQDSNTPKTIDRPYLMRSAKKYGASEHADMLARSLYAEITVESTVTDLISALKKSRLPIIPVTQGDQIIGTIGYKQIHALCPSLVERLAARVRPHAD